MWNVSDTVISPEMFAVSICDDFGVSPHHFVSKIVAIINERVSEYRNQIAPAEQPGPSLKGKLLDNEDTKTTLEIFKRAQADDSDDEDSPISDEIKTEPDDAQDHGKVVTWEDQVNRKEMERPMTVDELDAMVDWSNLEEELRLLIKVEILIGNQNLTDTFEWDLNSEVTPEEFAHSYCTELGLSGEFM
jgi:SWI/SNF-related matrix-associated actin-dependent regulator of chromatin subfamily B protein 1